MNSKTKNIGQWLPSVAAAFMIIMSASLKMSGKQELVVHYTQLGLVNYMKLFGTAELLFIVLFLYPRTMKTGFLLLTAYLGGAIATEVPHGTFFLFPAIILTLVWIAARLREPSIFFTQQKQATYPIK